MDKELNTMLSDNMKTLHDSEIKTNRLRISILDRKLKMLSGYYELLENDNKKLRMELEHMKDENKFLRTQIGRAHV